MLVVVVVVVLVCVGVGVGVAGASTLLQVGVCPNVSSIPDLDLRKLEGEWFHILHFPTDDTTFSTCIHSTYTYRVTEGFLEIVTEGHNQDGEGVAKGGVMARLPHSPNGALQLDMDGMPPVSLWVVYTDYRSVACMYSCVQFPGMRAEWAWAITRSGQPLVRRVSRCRGALRHLGVNTAKFRRIPQWSTCHSDTLKDL